MSGKPSERVCRVCINRFRSDEGWDDDDTKEWSRGVMRCPTDTILALDDVIPLKEIFAGRTTATIPKWCPYVTEHVVSQEDEGQ